jgi:putative ABC transport system permease protein
MPIEPVVQTATIAMIYKHLTLAWRHFSRHKMLSALNILGLSAGMACCMLIGLYLYDETHFDRHHERSADLWRVGTTFVKQQESGSDREKMSFNTPSPLGGALQNAFHEIEKTTRVQSVFDREKTLLRAIKGGQTILAVNEPKGYFADSTFFEMFHFDFLEGNPAKALATPQSVVLSETVAKKLFGNQPAYGQIVRISNQWFQHGDLDFQVTGVFRESKKPSHFDGHFYMSTYSGGLGDFIKSTTNLAGNNMFSTYLQLRPGTDGKALESKFPAFVDTYMAEDLKTKGYSKKQFLVAVPDIHLSDVGQIDQMGRGSHMHLYILGCIAAFTLLIACVNFMNLSTARSAKRASEVGVRKSIGATKSDLIGQFLGESILISMISFVIAMLLVALAMPAFNKMAERAMVFSIADNPTLYGAFGILALATGVMAGLYPAFFLSSFRPVEVLKGRLVNSLSAAFLRKGLVVFQFAISAALILASTVIVSQMHYLQSADMGFYKDKQIIVPLLSQASMEAYPTLKKAIQDDSRIASVGATQFYPGIMNPSDGSFFRDGQTVDQSVMTRRNWVDDGYLPTLGLQPVAGRLFSSEYPTDSLSKIILNETAVRKMNFTTPQAAIGQDVKLMSNGLEQRFNVIGVVKDFHFQDLHQPIAAYSFERNRTPRFNYLIARANTGDLKPLLASIEKTWQQLVPGEPFEYSFLDEDFQKNYKNDRQMAALVGSFTGIAIAISCLGLLGLVAFAAEQRTKEIGIRKVLGASVAGIIALLAKDFLKLVLVGVLIATPIAWWGMQHWLRDFAYRIDLQWWMFVATAAVAITIALLTVGLQSIKAARANPVQALRKS